MFTASNKVFDQLVFPQKNPGKGGGSEDKFWNLHHRCKTFLLLPNRPFSFLEL